MPAREALRLVGDHTHERGCCPDCCPNTAALRAVSAAVIAVASDLSVKSILGKIVGLARDLVSARYAALGVPDGRGGFASFITAGMTQAETDAIGPLPRIHGLLAVILYGTESLRSADIRREPSFGGWPEAHPEMSSFLGVPIMSKGKTIGAFYLTNKEGADEFTQTDQEEIEILAAHAAIAIENARLYERSRELSVVEERNRLARELHDSIAQQLFSLALQADAAATLVERDREAAVRRLEQIKRLATDAAEEMRSLIFELRPAELETEGLAPMLRRHVDALRQARSVEYRLHVQRERRLPLDLEKEIFRIAQEALNNALKHSGASRVEATLRFTSKSVLLSVLDDGVGFDLADAESRTGALGLTSMRERAEAIGGRLSIKSVARGGTKVRLEAPLG